MHLVTVLTVGHALLASTALHLPCLTGHKPLSCRLVRSKLVQLACTALEVTLLVLLVPQDTTVLLALTSPFHATMVRTVPQQDLLKLQAFVNKATFVRYLRYRRLHLTKLSALTKLMLDALSVQQAKLTRYALQATIVPRVLSDQSLARLELTIHQLAEQR